MDSKFYSETDSCRKAKQPKEDNIYLIKTDDSVKYMAETPNGSKVVLLTEAAYQTIVPRLWVQTIDDSKAKVCQ